MSSQEPKPTTETIEAKASATPRFADVEAKPEATPEAASPLKLDQEFEKDDFDGIVDVNALPALPWTRSALGEELFNALAVLTGTGGGAHTFQRQRNPSLDPRSFGTSRARYLIQRYGLTGERAQAYADEGQALQEAIDKVLPPIKGTPRNPKAKPLTPAKTIFSERGPKPGTWR